MIRTLTTFLLLSFLFLAACQDSARPPGQDYSVPERGNSKSRNPNTAPGRENPRAEDNDVINRHPDRLIYTKHARCRMNCRHIDEAEVQEILQEGRINYRKSEPAGRPDPKYALEGTTRDGQQVRIVFAPAKRGMVVITVIDLGTEWSCDCK
jgi:hypothetical protein